MKEKGQLRICVVGAGTRFLSGISYYTIRLANALSNSYPVSVITMRQMLPARFYPGRSRVGASITNQEYSPGVKVLNGVDWFWIPSILRAVAFLIRERPDVLIFQWWTGTVLHTYLLLAWVAHLLGAKIIVEFHEVLDTGEALLVLVKDYVRYFLPSLIRLSSGIVIHSEFDKAALRKQYGFGNLPIAIIPHGPYDQYHLDVHQTCFRKAPQNCCNLMYFGVIRPFKGLEDLVTAFDSIPPDEIHQYWLTIVGETWEGWTLPNELIKKSRHLGRITFVNRYVTDKEVAAFFAGADAAVLPYHRSSASGPLHTAMSYGLPVVVTRVGGLTEAVANYEGAILVSPHDPDALLSAIKQIASLCGKRFTDPHSWERNVSLYSHLFSRVVQDGKVS